jgi:hypothetical protein
MQTKMALFLERYFTKANSSQCLKRHVSSWLSFYKILKDLAPEKARELFNLFYKSN